MAKSQSRADIILSLKDNFSRGLAKASFKLKRFGQTAKDVGKKFLLMSAAIVAGLAKTVKMAVDLDDKIRLLAGKLKSVRKSAEVEMLAEEMMRLGRSTSFTASQVGDLMVILAQSGKTADEIKQMTGSVMDLAKATGSEAADASNAVTVALAGFELGAVSTQRVVDVLAESVNSSNQNLTDMTEAITKAAPSAYEAGVSIERMSAMINVLANSGIKGSAASTQLRAALIQLMTVGADKARDLGVSLLDTKGRLRDFGDIITDVNRSLAGEDALTRAKALKDIFGKIGLSSVQIIARNKKAVDDYERSLNKAKGTARAAAKEAEAGLGGSLRKLWSALEGLALGIGNKLIPQIQFLTDWITRLTARLDADKIAKFASTVASLAGIFGILLTAGGTIASMFGTVVGGALGVAQTGMISLGLGASTAKFTLSKMAKGTTG